MFFRQASESRERIKLSDVDLLAPITNPDKVLCIGKSILRNFTKKYFNTSFVGMNYKDHCEEQGAPIPKEPLVFSKFGSCIVGPTDPIPYPEVTDVS